MVDIEQLLHEAGTAVERMVSEAYKAGLAEGRREADDLRAKLAALIGIEAGHDAAEVQAAIKTSPARVAPGTVKPGILNVIRNSENGVTTDEVVSATGFKPTSVRGTLSTLAAENAIVKHDNHWFSADRYAELVNPDRFDDSPPQH